MLLPFCDIMVSLTSKASLTTWMMLCSHNYLWRSCYPQSTCRKMGSIGGEFLEWVTCIPTYWWPYLQTRFKNLRSSWDKTHQQLASQSETRTRPSPSLWTHTWKKHPLPLPCFTTSSFHRSQLNASSISQTWAHPHFWMPKILDAIITMNQVPKWQIILSLQ